MLLVQKYLEDYSFKELEIQHGVYATFSKCGRFWSMNYDQIESKESDLLSQQCRGLILSCEDNRSLLPINLENSPGKTIVLSYPMDRFFNVGQGAAASINWHDPKLSVLEKLDGSLCIVWYNPFTHKWNVATRSCPEANLLMDNGLFTFRTLFEKAVVETCNFEFEDLQSYLDKSYTYCFELTTPYNRIVVDYSKCSITLLAARNMKTMQEENPTNLGIVTVPVVQAYTYTSMDELIDWVSSFNPTKNEGVVVRDSQFNRIKIKNAAYVIASKCRDTLGSSQRNCMELILLGKEDDVIPLLPLEIVNNLLSLKEKFVSWLKKQEEFYQTVALEAASIGSDKKTFALTVQKYKPNMPASFFAIFDKKATSIRNFIDKNQPFSSSFLDKILECIS